MKGRCMTLRRYVVSLPRLALGAVVWLSVVASYNVTAAQVGYDPGHSPYHDIPRGAVWSLSGGHLGGSRGGVGVGRADGLTGGPRPRGAVGAGGAPPRPSSPPTPPLFPGHPQGPAPPHPRPLNQWTGHPWATIGVGWTF